VYVCEVPERSLVTSPCAVCPHALPPPSASPPPSNANPLKPSGNAPSASAARKPRPLLRPMLPKIRRNPGGLHMGAQNSTHQTWTGTSARTTSRSRLLLQRPALRPRTAWLANLRQRTHARRTIRYIYITCTMLIVISVHGQCLPSLHSTTLVTRLRSGTSHTYTYTPHNVMYNILLHAHVII